jgi:hypothetical protein
MYCAGDGNICQKVCGEIGKCRADCKNSEFLNELKNYQDMHLCKVRIKSEVRFSSLTMCHPLLITIQGSHIPSNMIVNNVKFKLILFAH